MTTKAQIYKSAQRGLEESEVFRRLSTFNFGSYEDSSRKPFGSLLVVNDETLGGGSNVVRHVEEATEIILIPLVGGILYKDDLGNEDIVGTEELRIFSAKPGSYYELINPYKNDIINYLQLWIRPRTIEYVSKSEQQSFDLLTKNRLAPLFEKENAQKNILQVNSDAFGFIGIYQSRKADTYILKNPHNGLFVFVINGAFEFENRLLESRDGLSLTGIVKAEFEALSENAIVLILEISLR